MAITIDTITLVNDLSYGSMKYKTEDSYTEFKLREDERALFAEVAYRVLQARHETIKNSVQHIATPLLASPNAINAEFIDLHDDVPF